MDEKGIIFSDEFRRICDEKRFNKKYSVKTVKHSAAIRVMRRIWGDRKGGIIFCNGNTKEYPRIFYGVISQIYENKFYSHEYSMKS